MKYEYTVFILQNQNRTVFPYNLYIYCFVGYCRLLMSDTNGVLARRLDSVVFNVIFILFFFSKRRTLIRKFHYIFLVRIFKR